MKKYLSVVIISFFVLNFSFGQKYKLSEIVDNLGGIKEKYKISFLIDKIKTSDFSRMWTTFEELENEDVASLNDFIDVFSEEFEKYSTSLVKGSKLKSVAFVKNLKYAGEIVSYFPDAYGETIFFNVEYGYYAKDYVRLIIHGSFFGMVEETFNKSIFYEDPEWQKINSEYGLTYKERPKKGSEGKAFDYKERPSEGFVNSYASYSIDKDMAQTFAYLMIDEKFKSLSKWIEEDAALKEKTFYIADFIVNIAPDMKGFFYEDEREEEEKIDPVVYEDNEKEAKEKDSFVQYGKASYYGEKYNGRKTANGEIFDDSKFTAAHKTLAFGTFLKVTNAKNNRSVIVRVNDRGPFVKGRILDLSTAAAQKIGSISDGVWDVEIEVVDEKEIADADNSDNYGDKDEIVEKNEDDEYKPDFEKLYQSLPKQEDVTRLKAFVKEGVQKKLDIKNLTAENLVNTAKKYLGVPYRTGGTSFDGMDCTGLTYRPFVEWGVDIPREGYNQARYGKIITSKNDLKPGDLVFFTRTYNTKNFITHAGIYVGNKKFINANSYYGRVMEDIIDDNYWKQFYIFGARYF